MIPYPVLAIAGGRPLRLVWANEVGGLTYELGSGSDRQFVKWAPRGSPLDLAAERARMIWAIAFTPVPRVLGHGTADDGSWLLTSGLPGESAVSDRWRADPRQAVSALGRGLRAMHDELPVNGCPFSWSAADRLARLDQGVSDPAGRHEVHRSLSLREALDRLAEPPGIDRLVVCHGEACAPNTLIDERGDCAGHVDLGSLGVADRWADLAIATWSTRWNYGPGWEEPLLTAYGIAPDPQRTRYFRLLWDMTP